MTRRRFTFWLTFGLFSLGEKLQLAGLDAVAAAAMRGTELTGAPSPPATPEHWTIAHDDTWHWFERESFVRGQWVLTGSTAPINKQTGQPTDDAGDYLDANLVPAEMRQGDAPPLADFAQRIASRTRRARHGRPPSKWLRSLQADEIRVWLRTIDVPDAGVSGMTYWDHLTRDHSFDPDRIEGLTASEQAKLHAAAHYGY